MARSRPVGDRRVPTPLVRLAAGLTVTLVASALLIAVAPPAYSAAPIRCAGTNDPVSGGDYHALRLHGDGTVWASGYNWSGRLGDGTTIQRTSPVQVVGLDDVVGIGAGDSSSFAIKSDGTLWAWGDNSYGVLGDGTTIDRIVPTRVLGLEKVVAVAGGAFHTVALTSDGNVWAWGYNTDGQLGNGTYVDSLVPVRVSGLNDVAFIDAGAYHSMAMRRDGTVWTWGWNGYFGQLLGNGSIADSSAYPVRASISGAKSIAAAQYHNLVVKTDGTVWAWGSNESGQVGDGTTWDRELPTRVLNITGVTSAAGGTFHSAALKSDGTVWTWGDNSYGQLGIGSDTGGSASPVQSSASGVQMLTASDSEVLYMRSDGLFGGFGDNGGGQLGNGSDAPRLSASTTSFPKMTRPGAPTEMAATAGNELAYVTWKAPENEVVTQYVVTPYVNGLAQPEIVTASPEAAYAVRGLTKGTTYSFTVAAQNCLGAGAATSHTNRVVPTGVPLGEQGFSIESQDLTDRMRLKVNAYTGNMGLAIHDATLGGSLPEVSIDRAFNSRSSGTSIFGPKWGTTVGNDIRTETLANGSVFFHGPFGAVGGYGKNADGTFATPAGIDANLAEDAVANTYTLSEHATGNRHVFDKTSGRLLRRIDRNNNTVAFTYNGPNGLLSSITDQLQRVTTFGYNAAGRLATITDHAGRQYQYGYDGSGRLTSHTDPAGGTALYGYDARNNIVRVTTPAGRVVDVTYDTADRVTAVKWSLAPGVPTTTFTYEADRTVVRDPNGNPTTYHLDPVGRTTKVIDALGNAAAAGYTSQSNMRQLTSGSGGTTTFGYASNHNLTSAKAPTGASSRIEYGDSRHPRLPTALVDPQGNRTTFAYDDKGNLITEVNQLPSQNQARATYNPDGTLATSRDPNGNTTSYAYDNVNGEASMTPPAPLGSTRASFDAAGRATELIDGAGRRTTYEYDAVDRPTKTTYHDGTSVAQAYDKDGNVVRMTDRSGTTVMEYDPTGRLVSRTTPDGETVSYTWDKAGNLTSVTTTGGVVSYAYNAVNLLVRLTEPDGAVTTFTYDASYNRIATAFPNGVTVTNAYDSSGRVTNVTALKDASTIYSASYSYANPATGNTDAGLRYTVTDKDGNKTTYSYDELNRLTKARTATPANQLVIEYAYTYDGAGNRLTRTVSKPSPAGPLATTDRYTYNAANQLTSVNGETVQYDAEGNLIATSAGAKIEYNAAGHTVYVQPRPDAGTTSTFSYLGEGQTERITGGAGGRQLSTGGDVCAPLVPCVNDPNKTVSPATYHSTVLGLSRETVAGQAKHFIRDPDGNVVAQRSSVGSTYLIADALGSIVAVTDESGTAVASFTYEPFGALASSVGDVSATPFRFAGAYLDPTGLYKMGERFYDPGLGRWTQQDPVMRVFDPMQWNRYAYVGNDPVNHTDLTGTTPDCRPVKPTKKVSFWDRVNGAVDIIGGVSSIIGGAAMCAGVISCIGGGVLIYSGVRSIYGGAKVFDPQYQYQGAPTGRPCYR